MSVTFIKHNSQLIFMFSNECNIERIQQRAEVLSDTFLFLPPPKNLL